MFALVSFVNTKVFASSIVHEVEQNFSDLSTDKIVEIIIDEEIDYINFFSNINIGINKFKINNRYYNELTNRNDADEIIEELLDSVNLTIDEKYKLELSNNISYKINDSYNGKEVIIGIRPENILLHKEKISESYIEAIIDVIEMVGSESYLYSNIGETQITIRINSNDDFKRDEKVYMELDMNKMHIFDKETEENIL